PLLDLDNVTVTPHLGANTKESQQNIAIQAAENAIASAKGISYPNALNLPIKESDLPQFLKPYLELIQKMGHMSAQVTRDKVKKIKIITEGEVSEYIDSLTTFATVGILKESLEESVNYVNAEFVANDIGIEIEKDKQINRSGLSNRVTIKLTTNNTVFTISGTVLGENTQRIIEIDGYSLDLEPKGKMILFRNTDVPGVIGDVGQIVAHNNLNISDFRLGRDKNAQALAVVKVDGNVTKKLLDELSSLETCISVTFVNI
ncbi:MAG TPA: ACT domain-containing protein, partial [Campylobacterales bacterium]|nr:ACT domain-containing protein [Campylobacterales bacterium]